MGLRDTFFITPLYCGTYFDQSTRLSPCTYGFECMYERKLDASCREMRERVAGKGGCFALRVLEL